MLEICINTNCKAIEDKGVMLKNGDREYFAAADTIVFSAGRTFKPLILWGAATLFRAVGDCVSPRFILDP
jgi:NADH dehydrogenase FAD-containing subunit